MSGEKGMPETREELDRMIDQKVQQYLQRVAAQVWHMAPHQQDEEAARAMNGVGNAVDDVLKDQDR